MQRAANDRGVVEIGITEVALSQRTAFDHRATEVGALEGSRLHFEIVELTAKQIGATEVDLSQSAVREADLTKVCS